MAERKRERIRHEHSSTRRPAEEQNAGETSNFRAEVDEELQRLDSVFDEYMANPAPVGTVVVPGQQQVQQVVKPLSDEQLIRGFRQIRGE